jgi:hypothetical protein
MVTRALEIISILVGAALLCHGAYLLSPIAAEVFVGLLFIGAGVGKREAKE